MLLVALAILQTLCLYAQLPGASPAASEFQKTLNSQVRFTENKGQVRDQNGQPRPDVLFSGESEGMVFHVRKDGISYQLTRIDSWKTDTGSNVKKSNKKLPDQTSIYRVDLNWLDFNPNYQIEKMASLEGYSNYYNVPEGVEPALFVKSFEGIRFVNLYPGIDLVLYTKDNHLEYDFEVRAGADYQAIHWEIKGAELKTGLQNELIMKTPFGTIQEGSLKVIQCGKTIPANWKLSGQKASYEIKSIDPTLPYSIDPPVRVWGSYYGSALADFAYQCMADVSGNAFLCGTTASTTIIATVGAHQTVHGGTAIYDAYIVKFNSTGVRQWGTYLGGTGTDDGYGGGVDASGNVYLVGQTGSTTGISSAGSHQALYGGSSVGSGADAYLAKFNTSGVRLWSTYYGGGNTESGASCTIDPSGNVFLLGYGQSPVGVSTVGSHQPVMGGGTFDGFVAKFNSSGVRQWGTFKGSTGNDDFQFGVTDASGNIYLTGYSTSTAGIATAGAHQTTLNGTTDATLTKFNSSGVQQWATYYGGNVSEIGICCCITAAGEIYISGRTASTSGLATAGAYQTSLNGTFDGYLAKFNLSGVMAWSTYCGGAGQDYADGCVTDPAGDVYLVGQIGSTTGFTTVGAYQASYAGGFTDGFITKFSSTGTIHWSTFYGGSAQDEINAVFYDPTGFIYICGSTMSSFSMGSAGVFQSVFGGVFDGYIAKFNATATVLPVTLRSFSASCDPAGTMLSWQTASETNNHFFSIERSVNGEPFTVIGTVNGQGTTSQASDYSFTDTDAPNEICYYRLRQTDYNGQYEIFSPIAFDKNTCGSQIAGISTWPNPTSGNSVVQFYSKEDVRVTCSWIDIGGRIVFEEEHNAYEGNNTLYTNIDILPDGVYLLQITGTDFPQSCTTRIIKTAE
jgi:Secretion system C-terminal sorting domain